MMLTKKLKVFLALVLAGVAAACQADPVPQIDDMVSAAMNGNEAKVLELKSRIELLPKPARGDRKRARSLNEQGLKELNAGNFAEAATAFEQAGSADPLDAEILSNEGYALIKADDPEAAIDPIERSIALQPGRASAWGTLGEALARSGFLEQATAAFNIAFTFSQNREKTKEFLAKLSTDDSSPVLVKATKAALAAEGVKASVADTNIAPLANTNQTGVASPTADNQTKSLSDSQQQQIVPSPDSVVAQPTAAPNVQATPEPNSPPPEAPPESTADQSVEIGPVIFFLSFVTSIILLVIPGGKKSDLGTESSGGNTLSPPSHSQISGPEAWLLLLWTNRSKSKRVGIVLFVLCLAYLVAISQKKKYGDEIIEEEQQVTKDSGEADVSNELTKRCISAAKAAGYQNGQCAYSFIDSCIKTQSLAKMRADLATARVLGMVGPGSCPNMPTDYSAIFDRF